ncbi:MAG: hypothetical protein PBV86_11810 [Delftia lacustris]
MALKIIQTTPSSYQRLAKARIHPPARLAATVMLAFAGAVLPMATQAQSLAPESTPSLYLQYGAAERSADSWTLGVTVPWRNWRHALWGGQLSGYWDIWGARWSAPWKAATAAPGWWASIPRCAGVAATDSRPGLQKPAWV